MWQYCFHMLLMALNAGADPDVSVNQLEDAVVNKRREIKTAHIVLNSYYSNEEVEINKKFEAKREIWISGEQIRCDLFTQDDGIATPHRNVFCRNCPLKGRYVHFTDIKSLDGVRIGSLGRIDLKDSESQVVEGAVIDIRRIGLVPLPIGMTEIPLGFVIGRADRSETKIESGRWKGQDCYILSYRSPGLGGHVRITIVPVWGHSVVQIARDFGHPADLTRDLLESDVKRVAGFEGWFPTHCIYTRHRRGKIVAREELVIDIKSLNQPIDPEVFRMTGMNVPKIPFTTYPGEPIPQVWDGAKLVANSPNLMRAPPVIPIPPRTIPSWLIGTSISALFVALAAIIQLYLKRRSTAS